MKSFALDDWSLLAQGRQTQPQVSVVMPVHNEEMLLPASVPELYDCLGNEGVAFEFILCENGSTDATAQIAKGLAEGFDAIKVLSAPDADYGRAIRAGIMASRAPYIFVFDADYYSIDFFKRALALLKKCDIVIASKTAPGAEDRRSIARRLVTRGFGLAIKTLFNSRVSETHGMKALAKESVTPIVEQTLSGKDLFDTELVIRAERSGLRIREVPVMCEEKRPTRSSIVRRIPRTIIGLLALRVQLWREGAPK